MLRRKIGPPCVSGLSSNLVAVHAGTDQSSAEGDDVSATPPDVNRRRRELWVFAFLTVVLFPLLAVGIVSGYGFMVWIWQIFTGPPGV